MLNDTNKLPQSESKHVTLNMEWNHLQMYTVVDVFYDFPHHRQTCNESKCMAIKDIL